MKYFKKSKKEAVFWISVVLVIVLLKASGLQAEVTANVQRLFLLSGFAHPTLPPLPPTGDKLPNHHEPSVGYPYDFALTTLEGKKANLKDLEGKVVFLNVWASWCPPCLAEMPSIFQLYQKTDTSKVAFVMLSVDEQPGKAQKYLARKKLTFPVYLPAENFPADLAAPSIPTTFILDTKGKIVARHEGMANYDTEVFGKFLLSVAEKSNQE